jgi:tetratricopeptide (TPR) repeat protein
MIGLVGILEARIRSGGIATEARQQTANAPMSAPFAGTNGSVSTPNGNVTPPALTGTPREQADRLFDRIMTTYEKGDTAQARFFLPMGMAAYQQAGDLDDDGLYHLALLQTAAGQYSDAIASTKKILAKDADHLLALGAAAEAAENAGDNTAAREYNEHFLRVYDVEKKKTKEEYVEHSRVLPQYEAAARKYLKK